MVAVKNFYLNDVFLSPRIFFIIANSIDPGDMSPHLDLTACTCLSVSRINRIKILYIIELQHVISNNMAF